MRIATIVQGRIFGFDLARGLLANGMPILLLTNYPRHIVERFGVPREHVRTNVLHGVATRLLYRLPGQPAWVEPFLHRWFSSWARKVMRTERVDAVQVFSGVAEELFQDMKVRCPKVLRILIRASTHIKTQRRILAAEQKRLGTPVEQPSAWRIAREVREYKLAHRIMLLSGFTVRSFLDRGYRPGHLIHLPMGADVKSFVCTQEMVEDRARRIASGTPLQVLTVGTFSARKGAKDMIEVARTMTSTGMKFRFIGAVAPDAAHLVEEAKQFIEFAGFKPQNELPKWYAQGDVFFFPTLEDGFPAVLAQALTGGLPLLTTPNSSAADLVIEGVNGWIINLRDDAGFVQRLQWCHEERTAFSQIVRDCGQHPYKRDWVEVSRDLLAALKQ